MTETEIDRVLEPLVRARFRHNPGFEVERIIVRQDGFYDVGLRALRRGRFAAEAHEKVSASLTTSDALPHLAHLIGLLDEVVSMKSCGE